VKRNRAKRRLRGALRDLHPDIKSGVDLVLVARPGLVEATWPDLYETVQGLLKQADLLNGMK
jgi:ribonuclease P protein component